MAFSKLSAAFDKFKKMVRVSLPPIVDRPVSDPAVVDLEKKCEIAAAGCSDLCRQFIISNMRAAGIDSKTTNLEKAIMASKARFKLFQYNIVETPSGLKGHSKGYIKFVLDPGLTRDDDDRKKAVYVQAESLNAGWVISSELGSGAKRAKRMIKRGVFNEKTLRPVAQEHLKEGVWKMETRGRINLGKTKVIAGRHFWKFNEGQKAKLRERFDTILNKLLRERKST